MFSLLSRFLQSLSRKPKAILLAVVVISLLSIYPVMNLRWELQLSDMLQKTESLEDKDLKVGKLLPLSLVLESSDSLALWKFASTLENELKNKPYVRFCSYYIDSDFYEKNQLLFLTSQDLNFIYQSLLQGKDEILNKQNPFIVQLEEKEIINADSLENNYRKKIKNVFSNESGTVRIFDVFPNIDTDILDSARFFVSSVKKNC